jgi:hypothetical protein
MKKVRMERENSGMRHDHFFDALALSIKHEPKMGIKCIAAIISNGSMAVEMAIGGRRTNASLLCWKSLDMTTHAHALIPSQVCPSAASGKCVCCGGSTTRTSSM